MTDLGAQRTDSLDRKRKGGFGTATLETSVCLGVSRTGVVASSRPFGLDGLRPVSMNFERRRSNALP
jgi:hypothetical protein